MKDTSKNLKKKICFISYGSASSNKGASTKIYYYYIKFFLEKNFSVHYLCFENLSKYNSIKNDFNNKALHLKIFKYKNALIPNRFSIIHDLEYTNEIREYLEKKKINKVVAFDIVAATQVFKLKSLEKYVWLGDLLYETNLYNYLYDLLDDWKKIKSFLYILVQNYIIKRIYKKTLVTFKKIIVSSKSSEKKLKKIGIYSKFLSYPWPIENGKVITQKSIKILFFGNLMGLGSKSSIRVLVKEIYPRLLKKFGSGNFEIKIVGKLTKEISKKFENKKEFIIHGFVKNLSEIFSTSTCLLFPGNVPVGNRCRIITAMSSKCLVVADQSTKLGNPYLIDYKTALLAKDSDELIDKIEFAVKNPEISKNIKINGYKTFLKYYSYKSAGNLFYKEIIKGK